MFAPCCRFPQCHHKSATLELYLQHDWLHTCVGKSTLSNAPTGPSSSSSLPLGPIGLPVTARSVLGKTLDEWTTVRCSILQQELRQLQPYLEAVPTTSVKQGQTPQPSQMPARPSRPATIKMYHCTFNDRCHYKAPDKGNVAKHIRGCHFHLPRTMKGQRALGIVEVRCAYDFIKKDWEAPTTKRERDWPASFAQQKARNVADLRASPESAIRAYPCRFAECGKSFRVLFELKQHDRMHRGVKPFRCKVGDCDYMSAIRHNAIGHIRMVHWNLPKSVQEQHERGIVDERKASHYLEVDRQLLQEEDRLIQAWLDEAWEKMFPKVAQGRAIAETTVTSNQTTGQANAVEELSKHQDDAETPDRQQTEQEMIEIENSDSDLEIIEIDS